MSDAHRQKEGKHLLTITPHKILIGTALASALTLTSAYAQTPDKVETRSGTLTFERGYPTAETTRKLFDELDYQRQPTFGPIRRFLESIRLALKQDFGADHDDMVIADNFLDPKSLWLTANDTTIYGHQCRSWQGRPGGRGCTARGHRWSDR